MTVAGTPGKTIPKAKGGMAGAPVLGYVFPTTLKPTDVGFSETEGIVALAITSHPDFDDTPLWDENNDRDYKNDGVSEPDVCIGDVFRVGTSVLQVSQPRQPCWKLSRKWSMPKLAVLVQKTGRTGWYLRVLETGSVESGDRFELTDRPHPDFSVQRAHEIMHAKPRNSEDDLLLSRCMALSASWREQLEARAIKGQLKSQSARLFGAGHAEPKSVSESNSKTSLGAALELPDAIGSGATKTTQEVDTAARTAAVDVAAVHEVGGQESIHADNQQDIRRGHVEWDAATGQWVKQWGVAPYNMVEVALHRDSASQHGPLDLFFAPVIGHDNANVDVTATAAMMNAEVFRWVPGSSFGNGLLPIAVDWDTWNDFINATTPGGLFTDDYYYNETTGNVTPGSDGVLEMNVYPNGTVALPPGNRGTVDLGSPNNSTADISRQILYGMNEFDFSFFPNGEVKASWAEPLILNGDTGLSAGIKDKLAAIIGEPRGIPIFSEVGGGNGNNAMYTIVKFVGIRIVAVKLTGNPNQKHVTIQPAPFVVDQTATRSYEEFEGESVMAPAFLIP